MFCLRGNAKNILNDNCLKASKQETCYKKYCNKIQKDRTTEKIYTKSLKEELLERDKTCRILNILNFHEKEYIMWNFIDAFMLLCDILDPCHIISRAEAPSLIEDVDNVFLASRYFHSLLDDYKDLVTQKPMTKEQRIKWIERIMIGNGLWAEGYSYEKFKKDKLK